MWNKLARCETVCYSGIIVARKRRFPGLNQCSHCGRERETDHRWCLGCKAAWARANRPKYRDMTPRQQFEANARSHANLAQKRGQITKRPCEDCGSLKSQKHHPDYTRPLDVIWLCRPCHTAQHRGERDAPLAIIYQQIRRELLAA